MRLRSNWIPGASMNSNSAGAHCRTQCVNRSKTYPAQTALATRFDEIGAALRHSAMMRGLVDGSVVRRQIVFQFITNDGRKFRSN